MQARYQFALKYGLLKLYLDETTIQRKDFDKMKTAMAPGDNLYLTDDASNRSNIHVVAVVSEVKLVYWEIVPKG